MTPTIEISDGRSAVDHTNYRVITGTVATPAFHGRDPLGREMLGSILENCLASSSKAVANRYIYR